LLLVSIGFRDKKIEKQGKDTAREKKEKGEEEGGEKGRNKYMYEKNQKPPHKTVQPHLS
jgi:hypothetical protein